MNWYSVVALGRARMLDAELKLFGGLRIVLGEAVRCDFPTVPCRLLTAFLALSQGCRTSKSSLGAALWPGEDYPPNRLDAVVYQLRRWLSAIRPSLEEAVRTDRQEIYLDLARLPCDYPEFQHRRKRAIETRRMLDWASCLAVARGPLLEGLSNPWASDAREATHRLTGQAADRLVASCETREDIDIASACITEAAEADPMLADYVVDAIARVHALGEDLIASVMAEQILSAAGPRSADSLDRLRDFALLKRTETRARVWCVLVLDFIPKPELQSALVDDGFHRGRTPDFWLSDSPETAWAGARRSLFERPGAKAALLIRAMDQADPLDAGSRSLLRRIQTPGIWSEGRAAWLFEVLPGVTGVTQPDGSVRLSRDELPDT